MEVDEKITTNQMCQVSVKVYSLSSHLKLNN